MFLFLARLSACTVVFEYDGDETFTATTPEPAEITPKPRPKVQSHKTEATISPPAEALIVEAPYVAAKLAVAGNPDAGACEIIP